MEIEVNYQDKNDLYKDLEEWEKIMTEQWIRDNLRPRKTPLYERTSYGIKHLLERDTDIYLTNDQFKYAMLTCGYIPVDPLELNWHFRLSKKSPAFRPDGHRSSERWG